MRDSPETPRICGMFTGLIQRVGRLHALSRSAGGWRVSVRCAPWDDQLLLGESVAVQGACLTVVACSDEGFDADVLDETLSRTALVGLPIGASLNLERALQLGDRLGGHLVSGHVDETGRIQGIERQGRDVVLTVACSPELARLTVLKGSITIDGISLTVTDLQDASLSVAIIPHTWEVTSLHERHVGDRVNLEADLLGKHVARLLGDRVAPPGKPPPARTVIDEAFLNRAGFDG